MAATRARPFAIVHISPGESQFTAATPQPQAYSGNAIRFFKDARDHRVQVDARSDIAAAAPGLPAPRKKFIRAGLGVSRAHRSRPAPVRVAERCTTSRRPCRASLAHCSFRNSHPNSAWLRLPSGPGRRGRAFFATSEPNPDRRAPIYRAIPDFRSLQSRRMMKPSAPTQDAAASLFQ